MNGTDLEIKIKQFYDKLKSGDVNHFELLKIFFSKAALKVEFLDSSR